MSKIKSELEDLLDDDELENAKEGADDLGDVTATDIASTALSANDWTTETIVNQIKKKNIILDPKFQRREAWRSARKSKFIESLILGLPVPQLVLAERQDKRGSYIIIDGKQRLLSIFQFAKERSDKEFVQLKLSGLDVRKDLNGETLESLRSDSKFAAEVSSFENQPIRTVVIRNWKDEKLLYLIFLRLNTGSVPLSPQELRQALRPGLFIDFVDEMSSNSKALHNLLGISTPDFRMRDVELLIRYFAFKNFLKDYAGSLKKFLDDTCFKLNSEFEEHEEELNDQYKEFEEAHKLIRVIFKENACRKWSDTKYEKRFNRAIFDIMFYYFTNPRIRQKAKGHERAIEQAFKNLCTENTDFLSSIETTTKSLDATSKRLSIWGETLNRILRSSFKVPKLQGNRIFS